MERFLDVTDERLPRRALGLPPPDPDWGSMVNEARRFMFSTAWGVIWPSLAISSLVVGLSLLADGLREELNRYQR